MIVTPSSSAPAKGDNKNSGNNENTVQVVLYSDNDSVIMTEVPKNYENEYSAKLKDSNFRNAEIKKSLGVNLSTATVNSIGLDAIAPEGSSVYYMRKAEVIKMVDAMDSSFNWGPYISNPLTDLLIGKAVSVITKRTTYGIIAGVLTWSGAWVMGKQLDWWKTSEIMILRKQITGVKLTVTPGPPSGYPAAYVVLTRY